MKAYNTKEINILLFLASTYFEFIRNKRFYKSEIEQNGNTTIFKSTFR